MAHKLQYQALTHVVVAYLLIGSGGALFAADKDGAIPEPKAASAAPVKASGTADKATDKVVTNGSDEKNAESKTPATDLKIEDDFDLIEKKMAAEREKPSKSQKSRQVEVEEELQKLQKAEEKADLARQEREKADEALARQALESSNSPKNKKLEEKASTAAREQLKKELATPVNDDSMYDWNGLE